MKRISFIVMLMIVCSSVFAQSKKEGYVFKELVRLPATSIKSQDRAGTCWAWSTISFLESEIIRNGHDSVSLSPMFSVWHAYNQKAKKYVRMHGYLNFGQGGEAADVVWAVKNFGTVPLNVYSGLNYGEKVHVFGEFEAGMKGYLNGIIENKNKKLSTAWLAGFEGILNAYLGKLPETFEFQGKTYTPQSYAKELGLNMDDYVSLTSFSHHPFYKKFALEVEDNWIGEESYNLPIEDMMRVLDYAIDEGYTFAWGSDVSETGFMRNGVAVAPTFDKKEMSDAEISKWIKMPEGQRMHEYTQHPMPEKVITQELRQEGFDNWTTTDDHGLHVIGKAVDQLGHKYFIVKNSWAEYGPYKGYFYASYPFVAFKTTTILINKNAIPKDIRKKMGIKK